MKKTVISSDMVHEAHGSIMSPKDWSHPSWTAFWLTPYMSVGEAVLLPVLTDTSFVNARLLDLLPYLCSIKWRSQVFYSRTGLFWLKTAVWLGPVFVINCVRLHGDC